MKTKILGSLIGAFMLIVCGIAAAQDVIKVGIAGPLSGSALNTGEQQEVGAQKAIVHLNEKGGLLGKKQWTMRVSRDRPRRWRGNW
jgi:branched-chain amino acid transport system substrate-binding protein